MKKLISIAIFSGVLCAGTLQAQTQTANSSRTAVPWSDPSRPGLVKVNMISGSISVRTHAGKDVIVEGGAVSRRGGRGPDRTPDGLTRIDINGGGFSLEEASNVLTISSPMWTSSGNIDIQVPVKTNLKISTINGNMILVDGVDGEIEVTNTNGDVKLLNVAGSVVAHAQNGNLSATVREVAPGKPMSFTSFNSPVDVTLPAATKADLKIRADHGEFYSNFDIKLSASAPPVVVNNRNNGRGLFRVETDRTTNGTINGGGSAIDLRTFNGNIYLRKGN